MSILFKQNYNFNASRIKIPGCFSIEIGWFYKHIWKERARITKTIKKKKKNGRLRLPNFKTKLRSYINEDSVVLAKRKTHGMTEPNWESRNVSTHRVNWFLTKMLRNFTEERIVRIVSSTSVTGQIRCPYTKKKKERKRTLTHILYYKQKWIKGWSKQITELKVKSKTIKVLTENTEKKIIVSLG